MTAGECLLHPWLAPKNFQKQSVKKLSTVKHKKFVARRKWQKAGLAVSSILRIGKLASNNLLSSGTSSPSPASSPSSSSCPGTTTTTTQSASPRKTDQKGGISNGAISLLTSAEEGNKMAAPEFVKEMIDVEVLEGDKARFDVKVKGSPDPEVVWHKEDKPLEEDGKRVVFEDDENGVHSLIFNAVTPADAGYYKVVVRNSGGEIESEAELYVEPTGGRPLGGTELYNT